MKKWCMALALTALMVGGCSGISVKTASAPGVDVGHYRTYAWYPAEQPKAEPLLDQNVRSSLERHLASKGYTKDTSGKPDFYVTFHTAKQQHVDVSTYGYGGYPYGGYGYWGGAPYISSYTEGTLIVEFIDPQARKVFWEGTASAVAHHPESPDPKRIDEGIAKLVQELPPASATVAPAVYHL